MSNHPGGLAQTPLRPGRTHDEEPPALPVTACRRCRKQKLRCSRDLPACKRCRDISAVCEYPLPPDRKLLAAQRLHNAKARARREPESSAGSQDQDRLSENADASRGRDEPHVQHAAVTQTESMEEFEHGSQAHHDEYPVSTTILQMTLNRTNMPCSVVATFLIEIYFTHIYNAHLLFHKETFLVDFAANKVPDFVCLAIFASASMFMRQSSGELRQLTDGDYNIDAGLLMLSAADWAKQGNEWANAACQRALMQADVPRTEVVQGCVCLCLYWWAAGQTQRTHIHSHNAYMNTRLLGLHAPTDDIDLRNDLTDETRRRLFWASWINQCIGQENASFKAEPWKDAVGLKFPSDEQSWRAGRPKSNAMFDKSGEIVSCDGLDENPITSESGELIKLVCLWWEIQRFLQLPVQETLHDATQKTATLLELDARLVKSFSNLHPDIQYLNASTFASPKVDKYQLLTLHLLYRSTACVLHSSVVPLFSNKEKNRCISKKAVRLSAEESVKHAAVILDMATAFMTSRPDIPRLPSIIGFAMFVGTTIQFKSLGAQRKPTMYETSRYKAAILILDCLKEYWIPLQTLWTNLRSMFSQAGINIDAIPIDPLYHVSHEEQNIDLDKIMSHERIPQGEDSPAFYAYITLQEKSATSPRWSSDTYSHKRKTKSAQDTPSQESIGSHIEGAKHTLPIHQRQDGQINPTAQGYTLEQQTSNSQPLNQGFKQQAFSGTSNYRQQSTSASRTNNFVPLGTVPEGFQTQLPSADMYTAMPTSAPGNLTNVDAFGSTSGLMDSEMEVDEANIWWDRSCGNFGMEIIDPNAYTSSEPPQFQKFSFAGYG